MSRVLRIAWIVIGVWLMILVIPSCVFFLTWPIVLACLGADYFPSFLVTYVTLAGLLGITLLVDWLLNGGWIEIAQTTKQLYGRARSFLFRFWCMA